MKKKDLRLELYAAQTQILELQEQIKNLNDQTPLITHLFEKIKELKGDKPCVINLDQVLAAI